METKSGTLTACLLLIGAALGCSPKDEIPLPSPTAKLSEVLPLVDFDAPPTCSEPYQGRLFIADANGETTRLLDGVNFFTLRRFVASTLQGARTFVAARSGSSAVGQWVTPLCA